MREEIGKEQEKQYKVLMGSVTPENEEKQNVLTDFSFGKLKHFREAYFTTPFSIVLGVCTPAENYRFSRHALKNWALSPVKRGSLITKGKRLID